MIVVDQAEEFLGSGLINKSRNRQSAALDVMATIVRKEGVRLVVSIRDDFMGKLRPLEDQFSAMSQRVFYLHPLTWAGARQAFLSSADDESDVEIAASEIDQVLKWVIGNQDYDEDQGDLLPVDMLLAQAFLFDIYNFERSGDRAKRNLSLPSRRLKIDVSYLENYKNDLLSEPRMNEAGVQLAEGPMLRWIDGAFKNIDPEMGDLVRRVAANMGAPLSTPGSLGRNTFKNYITEGDLVFHAIRKELPMAVKENLDINAVRRALATGARLDEDFDDIAIKISNAGFHAVECLLARNILKDFGTDMQGSHIYSLQHDQYGPALNAWCNDPLRRENDALVPEVGTYGIQIHRYTDIENRTLRDVIWEGCIVQKVKCKGVYFKNCKFSATFFKNCKFDDCVFDDCRFDGTVFVSGDFHNVEFMKCRALGMVVRDMNWSSIIFHDCNLSSAVIEGVYLDDSLRIEQCQAHYAQFYGFKKRTLEGELDITAHECDLHGALFKDYGEDRKRFDCKHVTEYTTIAPGEMKKE